jgi:hypothetical protein
MSGDELDRILDDALASYSLLEPRAGLPGRVMARVAADGAAPRRVWWWLAPAAAVLAGALIATVFWRSETHPPVVTVVRPPVRTEVETPAAPPPLDVARKVEHVRSVRRLPRRESFPSPAPLSAEERALLAFVQHAPGVARQLAEPDKPLEIEAVNIQPLQIAGLEIGEIK